MKYLICILFLLLTAAAFAQPRDTTYADSLKMLLMNDSKLAKPPLIVMDGYIYTGIASDIDPRNILNFDTLGQPGATNIYGEQGKNGVLLITTLNGAKLTCEQRLRFFSFGYSSYLAANNDDDSGLIYVVDGVVLDGTPSEIIKKLYNEVFNLKSVAFMEKSSEKLNTNNQKPMVVIITKK